MPNHFPNGDIAIIGMACRLPGANTPEDFWANISNKTNSITQFSQEDLLQAGISEELVKNPKYVRSKGYLQDADQFDADFFKFSKHEAEILDPQFRLFFEVTWEALENAAYVPEDYSGKIGVFAGSSNIDSYYLHNLRKAQSTLFTDHFTVMLHNAKDFLAALLAYKLNLRGPAVTLQTACSTSLVAVSMACQSLLSGESDITLAGGTCVSTPLKSGYLFQEGMMLSPSGKCSPFDKNADGTLLGNGAGVVVLKRLSDALADRDSIHAIIKGFAVNNDGGHKIGFTAPNVSGQQAVIEEALKRAQLTPDKISYIETHGTGTILGDVVELEALSQVFDGCTQPIALSSVKPNIGHLDAASGIASLIKAVLALNHKTLPPTLHFESASPQLHFENTSFYVSTTSTPWQNGVGRYVGVSSFGMGGTNAHVILGEAMASSLPTPAIEEPVLLFLSARSPTALGKLRENLASFLKKNPEVRLADVAYTLQVGRKHFKYRKAYRCRTLKDAIEQLQGEGLEHFHLEGIPKGKRIPLPTYPFERKVYWISPSIPLKLPAFKTPAALPHTNAESQRDVEFIEKTIKEIFERYLVQKDIDIHLSFQDLGGDSLVALLVTHEINKTLSYKLPFSIFNNDLSVFSLSRHIVNDIENQ